ncbi:hypothetical protein OA88_22745 [Flavobacterium sp. JRM]|nr:hypothetical protein OA88_22745 [Flavobacterium sp. JRM]
MKERGKNLSSCKAPQHCNKLSNLLTKLWSASIALTLSISFLPAPQPAAQSFAENAPRES